ncbi:MAG: EAL domain-containing protein, partial [Gammaproteobacteria bacterium]
RSALERELRHLDRLIDACEIVPWRAFPRHGYAADFGTGIERMTGYPAAAYRAQPWLWRNRIHPDDLPLMERALERLNAEGIYDIEFRITRADGALRWLESQALLIADADDNEPEVRGFLRDITERKDAESRIWHMAHHDMLTGLPNRNLMHVMVERALERVRRGARQAALMFIDLNDFKHVNDAMGHHVGDEVLGVVGQRLRGTVRAEDFVARLGGDEFVLLLEDLRGGATGAARIAAKILARIREPMHIGGLDLEISASLGIALSPDSGTDRHLLLRNADAAMYRAKRARDSGIAFYSPDLTETSRRRLALESALHAALRDRRLTLHYQPQVCLARDCVIGVEALLRWPQDDGSFVSPAEFVPLAEESGLIIELGRWLMLEAMQQACRWRASGAFSGQVAINISARQLHDARFVEQVRELLAQSGSDASWFELELTESSLLDGDAEVAERLAALRALGFTLALDDFGTGYSSLSYLRRFPIDRIKLDRSFVHGLPDEADSAAIVRAVVAVAQALEVTLVAEGVETPAQQAFLHELGCEFAQGFLHARPMPPAELGHWLSTRTGRAAGTRGAR